MLCLQHVSQSNILFASFAVQCMFSIYFQFMSEKIGGAKGTELDDEFVEMERVSKIIYDVLGL